MKRIILASASPRRSELLTQIGVAFEVMISGQEEFYQSTTPEGIVKELALMKAQHIAAEILAAEPLADIMVIGADTVVVLDNEILGKPENEQDAYAMLSRLQGRAHQVFTGVALINCDGGRERQIKNFAVATTVYVHEMDAAEINSYIQTGEPLDKAGAYGIQGRFAAYVESIEGDYYNVVGLPVAEIYQEIKDFERSEQFPASSL